MPVPTKREAARLIEAYSKFYAGWKQRNGVDAAFIEHVSQYKTLLVPVYKHFVTEIPNIEHRRRVLRGLVTLHFSCRYCNARICSPGNECGCRQYQFLEELRQGKEWQLQKLYYRAGRASSADVKCAHCGRAQHRYLSSLRPNIGCGCQRAKKIAEARFRTFGTPEYKAKLAAKGLQVKLLSDYQGMNHKIRFKCLVCGDICEAYAGNVCKGKGCFTCGQTKLVTNCLATHGVERHVQRKDVQHKIHKTMQQRYGVPHALQNPEIFQRQQLSGLKRKPYLINGETVYLQGYEPLALDWIQENLSIPLNKIVCGSKTTVPSISYRWKGKKRVYYPDFYIPHLRTLVEVKSTYSYAVTREQLRAKAQACRAAGYKIILMVMNTDGTRNYDYQND